MTILQWLCIRGLAFCGDYAVVTISLPRDEKLHGLAMEAAMKARGADPWRGLQIVDLRTGEMVEWLRFGGGVTEFFDIALINNIRCARGLGPNVDAATHLLSVET